MTHAENKRPHWVVIGRMCGDDEDTARWYTDLTRSEAIAAFKDGTYESEGYDEQDRERAESVGEGVFVNQVLWSNSPIEE